MTKQIRNVAASHRAKLLALSKDRGEDFQFLLGRWMIERFLSRLTRSPHKSDFILKGAMLFLAWGSKLYRPTRDLDLLGFGDASVAAVASRIREICSTSANDGIIFDIANLHAERIKEDAIYEGVRVMIPTTLDGARVTLQIDIGFGDAVEPAPEDRPFPTLLPLDPPIIRTYPPEAVIAEKFHAMVDLGIANSRMKDFFDIWTLATTQRFEAPRLSRSIRATFERRHTAIPVETPLALTKEFLLDPTKSTQWKAFCRRLSLRDTPSLDAIGPTLIQFLLPAIEQAHQQQPAKLIWNPPGPWL